MTVKTAQRLPALRPDRQDGQKSLQAAVRVCHPRGCLPQTPAMGRSLRRLPDRGRLLVEVAQFVDAPGVNDRLDGGLFHRVPMTETAAEGWDRRRVIPPA